MDLARDEAVVDEEVFLDTQLVIAPLEISSAVALDAMPERQVLGSRRRADGVGLDEAEPLDGAFQADGGEEATGDGETAEIGGGHHRNC